MRTEHAHARARTHTHTHLRFFADLFSTFQWPTWLAQRDLHHGLRHGEGSEASESLQLSVVVANFGRQGQLRLCMLLILRDGRTFVRLTCRVLTRCQAAERMLEAQMARDAES